VGKIIRIVGHIQWALVQSPKVLRRRNARKKEQTANKEYDNSHDRLGW